MNGQDGTAVGLLCDRHLLHRPIASSDRSAEPEHFSYRLYIDGFVVCISDNVDNYLLLSLPTHLICWHLPNCFVVYRCNNLELLVKSEPSVAQMARFLVVKSVHQESSSKLGMDGHIFSGFISVFSALA